ncbi:hypothetical protein OG216_20540 [Streptomycetaceae bacterium NBC_01309]
MRTRKSSLAAAVSAVAFGAVLSAVPQAQAAEAGARAAAGSGWERGYCVNGDACLYYNSNQQGSYAGVWGNINYIPAMMFGNGNGSGDGVAVKNNAASVFNMNYNHVLRIYYNSDFSCRYSCQDFQERTKANLKAQLKNNNASQSWMLEV